MVVVTSLKKYDTCMNLFLKHSLVGAVGETAVVFRTVVVSENKNQK